MLVFVIGVCVNFGFIIRLIYVLLLIFFCFVWVLVMEVWGVFFIVWEVVVGCGI